MQTLDRARNRCGEVFPFPAEGAVVTETPPTFCFLKADGRHSYRVTVTDAKGQCVFQGETEKNYLTPEFLLPPGAYAWRVDSDVGTRPEWHFTISEDAVPFLRPTAEEIFAAVDATARPRLLFAGSDRAKIIATHAEELQALRRTIAQALADTLPEMPRFSYDDSATPYREYFGRHRDDCDRNLIACALGWALLGQEAAGARGVQLLLTMCAWNPDGACSPDGEFGDEVGLSHARCFPAAFDMLADRLTDAQSHWVQHTILAYARRCKARLEKLDFCANPGASHAGRLPAYLGEAAIVLKGGVADADELMEDLRCATEIFGGIFPYYGCTDGGWAEGMFYASSYTKWFLPFFLAVERLTGKDYLSRPFYRNYPRFLKAFCPPGWAVHPFGDGYWSHPEDAEWPGFFAQNPYRVYAEKSGDACLLDWKKQAAAPDIFRLHLLDVFAPVKAARKTVQLSERAVAFPESGFFALHTAPAQPESEIALVGRASRFGSESHQHADQGAFALLVGGQAFLSPSGYFGRAYGTIHHLLWTNETRAHNVFLIDGVGQKTFCHEATGQVLYARETAQGLEAAVDLSRAYPMLLSARRYFSLCGTQLLIRDEISAPEPVTVSILLHSPHVPAEEGDALVIGAGGRKIVIAPRRGLVRRLPVSRRFDVDINAGVPAMYRVSAPLQSHMRWDSARDKTHTIEMQIDIL